MMESKATLPGGRGGARCPLEEFSERLRDWPVRGASRSISNNCMRMGSRDFVATYLAYGSPFGTEVYILFPSRASCMALLLGTSDKSTASVLVLRRGGAARSQHATNPATTSKAIAEMRNEPCSAS